MSLREIAFATGGAVMIAANIAKLPELLKQPQD